MTEKKKIKENRQSWIVKIRTTVEKELVVEDCTEEQAETDPYGFVVDETEVGMSDWEVLDVRPNI